jgi:CHAT domain-containing protein
LLDPVPHFATALVIADPSFGEPAATPARATRQTAPAATDLSTVYFSPLRGTTEEARAIQSLFPEATVLTGARATKAALAQAEAPRILHIASHGFFLTDPSAAADATVAGTRAISASARVENPLLRSGLALAGANVNKSTTDGGILTALEAANLNLWGTQLVTLSACDTGMGEVRNGEGVYGLRRAFFLAGAETLVMSLWPVSDYVTREMMTAYYTGLKRGLGRGEALRAAQRAMRARPDRQHPFYWASFIQAGDWRPLDAEPPTASW